MAVRHVCDGCGGNIEADPQKMGFVIKADYCEQCGEVANEYVRLLDELHDDVAEQFQLGVASLRERYGKRLQRLPDIEP